MNKRISTKLYALANGMSYFGTMGGNIRIFLELTKRLSSKFRLTIVTHPEGFKTCQHYGVKGKEFHVLKLGGKYLKQPRAMNFYAVIFHFIQTIETVFMLLKFGRRELEKEHQFLIYSSTDFWPDVIPSLIFKLKFRDKVKWIAGFWLFAPNPFSSESPYKGTGIIKGLFFKLYQLPVFFLIRKYADVVFVTSEPDIEKFITTKRDKDKIVVIRGGVDINPSDSFLKSGNVSPLEERKYDACFVGRFHYQKGVLELVDIWRLVCDRKPNAKLAMIGIGPLEKEVREKIRRFELQDRTELLGFKDGEEKYEIFKQSKIVVHPATYDSGGMSACEGMAWGLPGVSFDLEALKSYYPKGMLKTPCYDLKVFAENILKLLEDEKLYKKTSEDAITWAREWDWDKRADEILKEFKSILEEVAG